MKIDHLMWACSNLEAGIEELYELTGVSPEYSGSHQNMGTRNALLSLGDSYLEIIAPDPQQQLLGNFGARLTQLESTGLVALAMQHANLQALKHQLSPIVTSEVMPTSRRTADGQTLEWDLLFVAGVSGAPFYIDWRDCEHPSTTSPKGCKLRRVIVGTSQRDEYRRLTNSDDDQLIIETNEQGFTIAAQLESPSGIVNLHPLREKIQLF